MKPSAGLLLCLALSASAQLRWEVTTLEIDVKPGAGRVPLHFAFVNTGSEPVTITEVRSSCGCVVAESSAPRRIEPGSSGAIEAFFEPGERSGHYSTTLVVTTEGPGLRHTVLTAQFRIPLIADLNPRLFLWRLGEAATSRRGVCIVQRGSGLRFARLEGAQDRFRVQMSEPAEDGSFLVSVTPLKTDTFAQGSFRLIFENQDGEPSSVTFYAMVR